MASLQHSRPPTRPQAPDVSPQPVARPDRSAPERSVRPVARPADAAARSVEERRPEYTDMDYREKIDFLPTACPRSTTHPSSRA